MMLLRARDNNIQSFAYTWLHKGNQNEFLKHPKIKNKIILISFMKPGVRKTLNVYVLFAYILFQATRSKAKKSSIK